MGRCSSSSDLRIRQDLRNFKNQSRREPALFLFECYTWHIGFCFEPFVDNAIGLQSMFDLKFISKSVDRWHHQSRAQAGQDDH